jgi:small subunit ribosomal protein S16
VVKLRLRRVGKKKHPIYKIVATDSRAKRDGAYIESVGRYDPNIHPILIEVNEARVINWLRKGAQPTDTVRSLLRRTGLWMRWALVKQGKDEETIQKIMERWRMVQADRPAREADRKTRRAARKKKATVGAPSEPGAGEAAIPQA